MHEGSDDIIKLKIGEKEVTGRKFLKTKIQELKTFFLSCSSLRFSSFHSGQLKADSKKLRLTMTTAVVLVLCLVFASSNGHLFAEPGGIPPTSLSLTKIFDDFVYAITSKNVTAIASMIQDDCSALMTDQNCAIIKQQDDGGAA